MEQFYIIANQYYTDFYSFKGRVKQIRYYILSTILMSILFCFGIYLFIFQEVSFLPGLGLAWSSGIMLLTEILFILSWELMEQARKKLAIKQVAERIGEKSDDFVQLKKHWLKKTFEEGPEKYLEIAERFIKADTLRREHDDFITKSKNGIWTLLYEEQSKPRILALFLSLSSLIAVIVLKNEDPFEQLILLVESKSMSYFLIADFIIAFGFLITFVALKLLMSSFTAVFAGLLRMYKKKNTNSQHVTEFLIKDLIKFSKIHISKVQVNLHPYSA